MTAQQRVAHLPAVWRGAERVPVSDRERTIVDCLRDPELAGGSRHLVDIMREYGRRADRNFTKLASTTRGAGSGAAWKRLGYLAEALWSEERALVEEARRRLTAGYIAQRGPVQGGALDLVTRRRSHVSWDSFPTRS